MKVLLVEPKYKYGNRTKHEAKLCPVGLYKHYFYHVNRGDTAILVKGCRPVKIYPDLIKITTLFTYWSEDIYRTIDYYKTIYPNATIQVGGIFASLMAKKIKNDKPFVIVLHVAVFEIVHSVALEQLSQKLVLNHGMN